MWPNSENCPAGAAGGRSKKFVVVADAVATAPRATSPTIAFFMSLPLSSAWERAANLEAAFGAVERLHRAARGRDHVLHDREPESCPAGCAGAVGAVEALEQAGQVVVGHADAVVASREHDLAVRGAHREREGGARPRVADRVLHEVGRDDLEHALADRQLDAGGAVEDESHGGALGTLTKPGEHPVEHR